MQNKMPPQDIAPHRTSGMKTVGNQWMTVTDGTVTSYISDQWDGRIFGYEMRTTELYGDVHFAQSGQYVLGILGIGGGSGSVWRELSNQYGWHHLARDYSAADANISPAALSQAILMQIDSEYRALEIFFDKGVLWGSGLISDLQPESKKLDTIKYNIQDMVNWTHAIGKTFFVDGVPIALMEAENAPWHVILYEYGMAIRRIKETIISVTEQMIPPHFIICQHAGTRDDGNSAVALAEAAAMIDLWGLNVTIATPKYHLPIEEGTQSQLKAASARYVSEMEAHAHLARRAGEQWFCPLMTLARVDGNVITASFTLNIDCHLVLEDERNHGFSLSGSDATDLEIMSIAIDINSVKITLSDRPLGPIDLCYAWGQIGDHKDNLPANRGSLRDNWSAPSKLDPQVTLKRYALSQRITVFPSQA